MTTEPAETPAALEARAREQHAQAEKLARAAAGKEASQYWGYLIKEDKCGTDRLDRLLRGLGAVIVSARADIPTASPESLLRYRLFYTVPRLAWNRD
jgi:hypothetical protein